MKPLIYIAGPYTCPDPVLNTRKAVAVAESVLALGGAPVVPHLTMLWHLISPKPVEEWYRRGDQTLACTSCTSCGAPVLLAPNNRILTPEPVPLGIYGPDGHVLTAGDLQDRLRRTGLGGHGNHQCPAAEQAALFDHQEATG